MTRDIESFKEIYQKNREEKDRQAKSRFLGFFKEGARAKRYQRTKGLPIKVFKKRTLKELPYVYTCGYCKRFYQPKVKRQTFCSAPCRIKAYNNKQKKQ